MVFNSAICTSHSQSERLLALGLKKETADCMYSVMTKEYNGRYILEEDRQYNLCLFHQEEAQSVGFSHYEHIPAWSLHRLIEMLPKEIFHQSKQWHLFLSLCYEDAISYEECDSSSPCYLHFCSSDNIYDNVIESIEWLITEGHFNKEYLKER